MNFQNLLVTLRTDYIKKPLRESLSGYFIPISY